MQLATNDKNVSMTLKEITDLIDVRHDKAMAKIDKLAKEPSFGAVSKIDIAYNEQGQTVETYLLNSKQAIAAAARLNNELLMKVIDRLEELETAKPLPQSKPANLPSKPMEVLKLMFNAMEEQDNRITRLENTSSLDSGQQRKIQIAVATRVSELQETHKIDPSLKPRLFSRMHSMIKREFDVGSYKDIPKVRFDEAIAKINGCTFGGVL